MKRLQEKVREFISIEKDLREKIMDVERKDRSLIYKLEEALCFGKVVIVMRPLFSDKCDQILRQIKNKFWNLAHD